MPRSVRSRRSNRSRLTYEYINPFPPEPPLDIKKELTYSRDKSQLGKLGLAGLVQLDSRKYFLKVKDHINQYNKIADHILEQDHERLTKLKEKGVYQTITDEDHMDDSRNVRKQFLKPKSLGPELQTLKRDYLNSKFKKIPKKLPQQSTSNQLIRTHSHQTMKRSIKTARTAKRGQSQGLSKKQFEELGDPVILPVLPKHLFVNSNSPFRKIYDNNQKEQIEVDKRIDELINLTLQKHRKRDFKTSR
ncbi:hypothetical protein SNEBB_008156 [Seison nebaliae]|nr:hypothetical protein SNEBB_008156 [Seison nebaliae]